MPFPLATRTAILATAILLGTISSVVGADSARKAPKDVVMGVRADYGEESVTQITGTILRIEKQTDGTVYVIRVIDQEVAAFVPAKLALPRIAVGKAIQLQGAVHKKDLQKFWADAAKLATP